MAPDARLAASYDDLWQGDLFDIGKPFICLVQKALTSAEVQNLERLDRPVVFVVEKLSMQQAFAQWMRQNGKIIDLVAETPWQKQKRVEARIRARTPHLSLPALKALLEISEEQIDSEMDKLLTYSSEVTVDTIALLTPYAPHATIWAFLDALLQKDAKKALELPLAGQESLFGLLKLVRTQQKNLLLMKSVLPGDRRVLMSHIKDRQYENLQAALPRFSQEELERSLINLDRLDFMMRDGLVADTLILTLMVSYLSGC